MYIVIDTNIFYNNWFVSNADFKYLFNYIENTNSKLLLSELVCQEVENVRNRELNEIVRSIEQSLKKAAKLTAQESVFAQESIKTPYSFKQLIKEKCWDVDFIPYDGISQTEVVSRALQLTRPFQEEDKGYRDTLIWLSLLEYLKGKEITGEVVFITNNKEDFYSKGSIQFHEDLLNDISRHSIKANILPFDSLFSFIKSKVDKTQHEFTARQIQEDYLDAIEYELEEEVSEYFNSLSTLSFIQLVQGIQSFYLPPYITYHKFEIFEGLEDIELISYEKVDKNIFYINYQFELRWCTLIFTIPTQVYLSEKHIIDSLYYDIDMNREETTISSALRLHLNTTFNLNTDKNTVEGLDVHYFNARPVNAKLF